jgi:ligand-binding sensor domain-containing protein
VIETLNKVKCALSLAIMMLLPGWVNLYSQNLEVFDHLSVNDGLSQSTIYTIGQDAKGFMWFGTREGGLNRYDGYDFQIYRNNPGVESSLSDNRVISILEDSRGKEKLNAPVDNIAISHAMVHFTNVAYRIKDSFEVEDSGIMLNRKAMDLWSREYEPGWEIKL